VVCWAALASSAASQQHDVQRWVAEAEALGARTGCMVLDLDSGHVLYEHRGAEPFVPASNQKLLTAVAALEVLGADYHFATAFALVEGRLQVTAGGDPNWRAGTDHDPELIFAAVAAALRSAGVTAVRGIDLRTERFPGAARPYGWPADQLENYYCAPTGGLVLEEGCFRARIVPGDAREALLELIAPPTGIPIEGAVLLTDDQRRGGRYGMRDAGGRLVASGHYYRRAGPREVVGAVGEPEEWFRAALEHVLQQNGIALDPAAEARDVDLITHRSSLLETLPRMLVDSNNFLAEQLLRVIGAEDSGSGTFAAGAAAIDRALTALVGGRADAWEVADGSGLSRDNTVTPAWLVAVLGAAAHRPYGDLLRAALPSAGDGTLRNRLEEAPVAARVRAKTGWIRGASTLSGYVDRRVFAITMSYDRKRSGINAKLKALQDHLVEAFAALEDL
jgi:D-alanyl-D-alanine carboxypeptidase/D-alanyl-D-alanine-endopeptidase (penicillin-binding protein 4)